MTIRSVVPVALLPVFSLSLLLAAGCDGDDQAATDSGTPDSGAAVDAGTALDSGSQVDVGTQVDAGTPVDAGSPVDAGAPDSGVPAAPRVVPVSAAGHDRFFGVAYDAAGNFYATGVVSNGNVAATADFETVVAKFTPAGALDTTFGGGGFARRNLAVGLGGEVARGIVVQASGRIVVAATVEHAGAADVRDRDLALARFNADGTRDPSFGTDGVVTLDLSAGEAVGTGYVADSAWGLSAYGDGRLVVTGAQKRAGGTDTDFAVLRLSADGVRDASFGTNGLATLDINHRGASPRTATILADGSIIVTGYMDDGGVVKPVLFKLTSAGVLDATFGTAGVFAPTVLAATTEAYGAVLQGTSFVTAGYGRNAATESLDWVSLRVSAAGALDPTWGTAGVARLDLAMFNDNARGAVALPDGRTLLLGGGRPTSDNVDGMLAVLDGAGQPDPSFGARGIRTYDFGGASDFFWGAALNPARTRVALVGVRGVAAPSPDAGVTAANDDAVVYLLTL
ncbi:MAG: hypothetical protein JWM10_4351 [Myxococcaceae bacterium]|nr:hypothetical protein [Myxococcaceae bacterium]